VKKVAEREGAIPYDIPGSSWAPRRALLVRRIPRKVRARGSGAAHAGPHRARRGHRRAQLTPESAGLYALATGFQAMANDDYDNMAKQFPAYDALYAYCRAGLAPGRAS